VRAGLVDLLTPEADLDPVAAVADAHGAAAAVRRLVPDVAIVDYRLPGRDGLSLTIELKRLPRPPGIVLYSAFADGRLAVAATVAGADALVKKSSAPEELAWTLRRVATGLRIKPEIAPNVLGAIEAELPPEDAAILALLMDGLTPGHVAQALGMTDEWTVIRRWAIVRRVIARIPGSRSREHVTDVLDAAADGG
jgi:two-component system nitrate/nitrite response regulator NarL